MKNNKYTPLTGVKAVLLYLNRISFNGIKQQLGVSAGQAVVYSGLSYLNKKHNLNIQRDRDSNIGFSFSRYPLNRDALVELINKEIDFLSTPNNIVEPEIDFKDIIVRLAEDIHIKRMEFLKAEQELNNAILKLERSLK